MTMHKHLWETVELDAGGYHVCKKCKLGSEGEDALATPCPVSDAEHHADAWLGLFALYLTREEAELNGEPQPTPVSRAQLLQHAQRYLLITRHLGLAFKAPHLKVTKTPEETDAAIDTQVAALKAGATEGDERRYQRHVQVEAESCKLDLNFRLLQLAEQSCSLLEHWVQLANVCDENLTDLIKETRALLDSTETAWTQAASDIHAERRFQITAKGWTTEHDDLETNGELAAAAATFALRSIGMTSFEDETWPWERELLKPGKPRRMLVKAGALILAELERLDRRTARVARND